MSSFDVDCRRCNRLATFLDEVKIEHPGYYAKPVPPFGAKNAKLLIVGLAPGMHGANRTGRPFTGDHAGVLLYQTLYKYGFSNKSISESADDKLKLKNCRITNAVKCLPPQNKPTGDEVTECNVYLVEELNSLKKGSVILALGILAHNAVLKALGMKMNAAKFSHNTTHALKNDCILLDSYHCSRYNTQTKRLTEKMFCDVFANAKKILAS